MTGSAQLEETKLALDDLFKVWDRHASLYGKVMYACALARHGETWQNVLTYFLPLHPTEIRQVDLAVKYKAFTVMSGTIEIDHAKQILTDVVKSEKLCLPDLPSVHLKASLYSNSNQFVDSGSRRFPVYYPFREYEFHVDEKSKARLDHDHLWALDSPVYPDPKEAIKDLLFSQVGDFSFQEGKLMALAPDYRARIHEVRISNNGVVVDVECPKGSSDTDVLVKIYHRSSLDLISHGNLALSNGQAVFETKDYPRRLLVVLLSKKDGDMIDRRNYHAGSYVEPGIQFETPEQDIEYLIASGESETLEFKQGLPKKNDDIAVAVTSFANTHGGQILVGVDDNGQIVGWPSDKPKERLMNIVRQHSDPPVFVEIEIITISEKSVAILRIPEGNDKPYMVKDKGVYVRSGSTSRIATRYELDAMRERNPPAMNFPTFEA